MDSVRVLHVDDDPEIVDVTATYLEREDSRLDVETATTVSVARERLATDSFDCIVSDYDMPEVNGIEFLEEIKADYPDLPFILFTGKGSEQVASQAISADVTDYLQKQMGPEQYELLANRILNAAKQYRAQTELERQRTILSALIENLPVGVLVEDESREILAANSALVDIFDAEIPPEGLVGEDCAEMARELQHVFVDPDRFLRSIESHLDDREPRTREEFELDDGRVVERDYVPYELPDGEANLWVYTDVTRDREREQLLTGLFEKSLLGIGLKEIITDENGDPVDYRYLEVNDQFGELTGLDPEEVVGQRATEVIDGIEETPFIETFGEIALEDTTARFEQYSEPLGRHYEVSAFSPRHGQCISLFADITDRKERERELERFKFFVEHTPDLILLLDEEFTVEYQSPVSPVADFEPVDMVGENPLTHIHPEDRGRIVDDFERLLDDEEYIAPTEYRAKGTDGEWHWFENRAQNYLGEEPIDAVVVAVREVTRRKEQERELRRQNERLEEFASIVSHDLRNPLNVATSRRELASMECDSPHLDKIADAHDRMEALIDDLLMLARQGEQVSETEPVDLESFARKCWRDVEPDVGSLEIETGRTVRADRGRLRQLFENLFRNAVEHGRSSEADAVAVTVGEIDGGFYVEDDGPGVPETDRTGVFEFGYSTDPGGTGLGLNIVREIAEAHGWEIDLTGGTDGGARFEVTGVEFDD